MKFTPYSFSKINSFEACPYKFKLSYIDKISTWTPNLATERGSYIDLLLENYTKSKPTEFKFNMITPEIKEECDAIFENFKNSELGMYFFDDSFEIEAEVSFGVKYVDKKMATCEYKDKEALFRGKIDHFMKRGDKVIVADWKTGKVTNFPAPLQLVMYAVWIFLEYDEVQEIETYFVYVEHNDYKKYVFKRDHFNALLKKSIEKIYNIEKTEEYKKKESKLCDYCDFMKEGYCTPVSAQEFSNSMNYTYTPKTKVKKDEDPRELYFYIHPESGSAWIQDYPETSEDGLTEEIDESMYWNLIDFGYDESEIDGMVLTKEGDKIHIDNWRKKFHKK